MTKKGWRILLNIAVMLMVAGFVAYMFSSVNEQLSDTVTVAKSGESFDSDFVSACTLETSFTVPQDVRRFKIIDDVMYIVTDDSVLITSTGGSRISAFAIDASRKTVDVAVDGDEIYLLGHQEVNVFDKDGGLVNTFEACSDNSLFASIALTKDCAFITDAENLNINRFTRKGDFAGFIESRHRFVIPTGEFDIEAFGDTVYCVNSGRHLIESYLPDGRFLASFGVPGSAAGAFSGCSNPASIVFTSGGRLLTSEKGNPRVCLYERSGRFVEMLLNARMLGGGHEAYEIQTSGNRLFVACRKEIKVFRCKNNM
ncbi:MAG: hypothetical protein LBG96_10475 [Tannerella sp.]|jgi:hypothetical protein|nr:hypothetical protein [Tannerella sp.]